MFSLPQLSRFSNGDSNGDTDASTSELRASATLFLSNTENLKKCESKVVFSVETFIRNIIEILSVVAQYETCGSMFGSVGQTDMTIHKFVLVKHNVQRK
jgi:hypothetical protein